MSSPALDPHSDPAPPPSPKPAQADYYRQALHACIDAGANIVRILNEEAEAHAQARTEAHPPAPESPAPASPEVAAAPERASLPEIAIAFGRVSRAVRLSILLAQSLDNPAAARTADAPLDRTAARRKLLRTVEDRISERVGGPEADALHAELRERLDSPDLERQIASRPIDDVITEIVRDLGCDGIAGWRPFKRRTPADIATLDACAAAPPGQAANPALATTWPPTPNDNGAAIGFANDLVTMLNPTRFRGK